MTLAKPLRQMNIADLNSIPNFTEAPLPKETPFPCLCDICGEECTDVEHYGMDTVCQDCKAGYLREKGPEYYGLYIAGHQEGFLLDWWLDEMMDDQKERLIAFLSAEYKLQQELDRRTGRRLLAGEEADYCTSCPDFYVYLEEQLKGENENG